MLQLPHAFVDIPILGAGISKLSIRIKCTHNIFNIFNIFLTFLTFLDNHRFEMINKVQYAGPRFIYSGT